MQRNHGFILPVYILVLAISPAILASQVVVGSGAPDGSALLEVQSNTGGVLFPRLTISQRDAIPAPAVGLVLYNTGTNCLEINVGNSVVPEWGRIHCREVSVAALNCSGADTSDSRSENVPVSVGVPYTGGNGGVRHGQPVFSTNFGAWKK